MTETQEFSTAAIASITSGVLLCQSFGEMQEAAEYLMGHPIWTHHFADKGLIADMRRAAHEQCPGLPKEDDDITPENFREKLAALEAEIGKTTTIRKGGGLTAMLPTDGIPDHLKDKTTIIGVPRRKR